MPEMPNSQGLGIFVVKSHEHASWLSVLFHAPVCIISLDNEMGCPFCPSLEQLETAFATWQNF